MLKSKCVKHYGSPKTYEVHLKFSGEDTITTRSGFGWDKDERSKDFPGSRELKMSSSINVLVLLRLDQRTKDSHVRYLRLLHRRRGRLLHYPPSTVPHWQISQTDTFPSSTCIWSAPWTPPSRYWRVSVSTKAKPFVNVGTLGNARETKIQDLTRTRACSGVSTSPSLHTS